MSDPPPVTSDEDSPNRDGKFSVNEDWLATVIGLVLLGLVLLGAIPAGVIP